MGDHDAAQAEVLIRALCDVRNKMLARLKWLEQHDGGSRVFALRRDIDQAQTHIDQLHRQYLGGSGVDAGPPMPAFGPESARTRVRPRRPGGQANL